MMGTSPPPQPDTAGVLSLLQIITDPEKTREHLAAVQKARDEASQVAQEAATARAALELAHRTLTQEQQKRADELVYRKNEIDSGLASIEEAKRAHDIAHQAQNKQLDDRAQQLSDLAAKMDQKSAQLGQQDQALRERSTQLDARETALAEREAQVTFRQSAAEELKKAAQDLMAEAEARFDVLRQAIGPVAGRQPRSG